MGYLAVAEMQQDGDLARRIAACAALNGNATPDAFTAANMWRLVARTDWEAAWSAALAGKVEHPGRDEGVVTDAMIFASYDEVARATAPTPQAPDAPSAWPHAAPGERPARPDQSAATPRA